MLAKNLRTPRAFRMSALSLTFFASKLAPTRVTRGWNCASAIVRLLNLTERNGCFVRLINCPVSGTNNRILPD
ncbi:hypothetical protein CEC48_27710 [Pseudomonas sp. K2I15]|nr:hypothetical protein CEC48_27710 [Pseudomonas sp. K2I15]